MINLKWLFHLKKADSTYFSQSTKVIRTLAIKDAKLAKEFGKEKSLTPIVWSHGLIGNSNFYNILGMEFASNGYIVFIPDHLDGSASYTELKDGSPKPFDITQVHPDDGFIIGGKQDPDIKKYWCAKIDHREKELS